MFSLAKFFWYRSRCLWPEAIWSLLSLCKDQRSQICSRNRYFCGKDNQIGKNLRFSISLSFFSFLWDQKGCKILQRTAFYTIISNIAQFFHTRPWDPRSNLCYCHNKSQTLYHHPIIMIMAGSAVRKSTKFVITRYYSSIENSNLLNLCTSCTWCTGITWVNLTSYMS